MLAESLHVLCSHSYCIDRYRRFLPAGSDPYPWFFPWMILHVRTGAGVMHKGTVQKRRLQPSLETDKQIF